MWNNCAEQACPDDYCSSTLAFLVGVAITYPRQLLLKEKEAQAAERKERWLELEHGPLRPGRTFIGGAVGRSLGALSKSYLGPVASIHSRPELCNWHFGPC